MLFAAERLNHRVPLWVALLAAGIAGLAGFLGGFQTRSSDASVLHGIAYTGLRQATIKADGWNYGVVDSVEWIDRSGAYHESGWPDCLSAPGSSVPVTFGATSVRTPEGVSWREVTWVDCRPGR